MAGKTDKPSNDNENAVDLFDAWSNAAVGNVSDFLKNTFGSWNQVGRRIDSFFPVDSDATEAYPVPTLGQYSSCLDKGGKSIWTEDGYWRCLLKGAAPPSNLKQFPDYISFLEYQKELTASKIHSEADKLKYLGLSEGSKFSTKFISEEEAKGKTVAAQSSSTEAATLQNGLTEFRTKTIKYYDDGTASIKTTTDSSTKPPKSFW